MRGTCCTAEKRDALEEDRDIKYCTICGDEIFFEEYDCYDKAIIENRKIIEAATIELNKNKEAYLAELNEKLFDDFNEMQGRESWN